MDLQGYLTNSYRLIRRYPLELILGGLLVELLTALSFGILAGPLLGGYLLSIILCLRQDRPPRFVTVQQHPIFVHSGLLEYKEYASKS